LTAVLGQKHFDDLFPAISEPSAETLAQAALFVALRDQPNQDAATSSPWTSLLSRRFSGDVYERIIALQKDDMSAEPVTVNVKFISPGHFDVTIQTPEKVTSFLSVCARTVSSTTLSSTINFKHSTTTIVSQPPPPWVPASTSPNTMERLHIFDGGQKTTLVLPPPNWLLSLGGDILGASKGALKAPNPSLVVEVRAEVGDRVNKGQAVVVLESMKTETVLRSDVDGVVRAVCCKKGEMVEEGRNLVDIEADETAS
jgi:3-methylcrotonyl-CoA carboxylase alpha subunit